MDEDEVQRIVNLLGDVRTGLWEGDTAAKLHLHLAELYRTIPQLTDATFKTEDQGLKIMLTGLEHAARLCKQDVEGRLGVRN